MDDLLQQFITQEGTASVRRLLEDAIADSAEQHPHFEFNRFEITIERQLNIVVLEDVLDATSAGVRRVPLADFTAALRNHMPTLVVVSEQDFARFVGSRVLIAHEHARRFAALKLSSNLEFGVSWHSDGIEPELVVGPGGEVWVGVDQRVACVSPDGRIVLSLAVGGSVLSISTFEAGTVVLCDAEGTVFNRDYSLRATRPFVTLPVEVSAHGAGFLVRFDDGTTAAIG